MDDRTRQFLQTGQRAGMMYAVVAPQTASMGLAGAHLANRPGSSLEFMDHREYQPGDDLRRIDWSAYARTGKMIVKLYRQEVNPHVDILVDGSESMKLADSAKHEATVGLTAALASATRNAGFSHTAWLGVDGWQMIPGSKQLPTAWEQFDLTYRGSLAESMQRMPPVLPPQSIRVLISDLLWLGDPVTFLSHIAQKASAVVVVQLLARADVDPPARGSARLVDCESGDQMEVFVDAAAQRRYRDAMSRHQQNWSRAARQVGANMVTLIAEETTHDWQLTSLVAAGILKVAGT
jgi:uncharacterized protein (DUF58 family)